MINNMQPQMYGQLKNYQTPEWQRMNINPYMRGFPQQLQQTGLPGKYIQSLNDVVVSEVPQDGSVAFFPTSDFSKIYAKAWTADGKIQTEEYVQVKGNQIEMPGIEQQILSRLEKIEEMLTPQKKVTKKKEADSDD